MITYGIYGYEITKTAELGESKLRNDIFKSINTYLENNNLNPNEYKRDLTLTIDGNENTRIIFY